VRLRTKTTDESWNTAGEEEKEQEAAAGASSKEPGGATKVEAYGGGEELVGTSEKHGELTSTALKVHDREGPPQPKRQRSGDSLGSTPGSSGKKFRQMSIAAMFGSPSDGRTSFSSHEQVVREVKGKMKEKLSFAEKEAILKNKFEEAGVGYVPNGSRDRFGRPRSNVGGRPRKQMADTADHHKRPGTKRSKLEFPAPELLAMGELVQAEIDKFWQKHSEQREDKALQKQLDQRLLTLWPGWKIAKIKGGCLLYVAFHCFKVHL